MNGRGRLGVGLVVIALLSCAGCATSHKKCCAPRPPACPTCPPPPRTVIVPGQPPAGVIVPQGAVFPAPPPGGFNPGALQPQAAPPAAFPGGPPPEIRQRIPIPGEANVAQDPVRLTEPQAAAPAQTPLAAAPPSTPAPTLAVPPPAGSPDKEPPSLAQSAASAPPLDLPQFLLAKNKVATGLQPFPDGVTWLRSQGYKAVLHVRQPGEDDSAARRQFEKNGLNYLTLEVKPGALTREAVEAFNNQVTDAANLPLFVYDKEGALIGGLWYLHFHLIEGVSEEKARQEALRIGLKPDQEGEHKAMWTSCQAYLQGQNR